MYFIDIKLDSKGNKLQSLFIKLIFLFFISQFRDCNKPVILFYN